MSMSKNDPYALSIKELPKHGDDAVDALSFGIIPGMSRQHAQYRPPSFYKPIQGIDFARVENPMLKQVTIDDVRHHIEKSIRASLGVPFCHLGKEKMVVDLVAKLPGVIHQIKIDGKIIFDEDKGMGLEGIKLGPGIGPTVEPSYRLIILYDNGKSFKVTCVKRHRLDTGTNTLYYKRWDVNLKGVVEYTIPSVDIAALTIEKPDEVIVKKLKPCALISGKAVKHENNHKQLQKVTLKVKRGTKRKSSAGKGKDSSTVENSSVRDSKSQGRTGSDNQPAKGRHKQSVKPAGNTESRPRQRASTRKRPSDEVG